MLSTVAPLNAALTPCRSCKHRAPCLCSVARTHLLAVNVEPLAAGRVDFNPGLETVVGRDERRAAVALDERFAIDGRVGGDGGDGVQLSLVAADSRREGQLEARHRVVALAARVSKEEHIKLHLKHLLDSLGGIALGEQRVHNVLDAVGDQGRVSEGEVNRVGGRLEERTQVSDEPHCSSSMPVLKLTRS